MSARMKPVEGRAQLTAQPGDPADAGQGPGDAGAAAAVQGWQMLAGLLEATRLMPESLLAPPGSLPLTILSGFLGAGKTTLVNRLLEQPGGRRIVVLVNDFGRINIDAALIGSRTDDMISLTNGCACCTVSSDLTRTLIDIAQRPDRPDALVLEASGLADPRGIAQVALANPALRLDGVITLVDAAHHGESRQSAQAAWTVDHQIDAADLLVLTKTDLASAAELDAVRALLHARHPDTPVLTAMHGDLPADVLLGVHSARDPRQAPPASWEHAAGFAAWCLQSQRPLDDARLRAFLAALPPALLRAKGVLQLAGDPLRRHVYQRVGRRSSLEADGPWRGAPAASSLVLIGPKDCIDAPALQRAFDALAAAPALTS